MKASTTRNDAVKAVIPAQRRLGYQVKDGSVPLGVFLGVPVPATSFLRTNDCSEFWDRGSGTKYPLSIGSLSPQLAVPDAMLQLAPFAGPLAIC
jgi:sulfotransferase family protein